MVYFHLLSFAFICSPRNKKINHILFRTIYYSKEKNPNQHIMPTTGQYNTSAKLIILISRDETVE